MEDEHKMTAEEVLLDNGYEGTVIFGKDCPYDSALIGVSSNGCAIYDYNRMVEWLTTEYGWDETEAIEWIDYNTIRSLPYAGEGAPIVMYPFEECEEPMRFLDVLEFEEAVLALLNTQKPKTAEEMGRFSDDMHKAIETAIAQHLSDHVGDYPKELPDVYEYRPYY